MLATLRRAGDPHMLTAGALSRSLMVTGGANTARINRLIAKGIVDRREDPANRRSMQISLTPEGLELIDRILPEHVANQRDMLSALTEEQQQQLTELLRVVLAGLEVDSHAD